MQSNASGDRSSAFLCKRGNAAGLWIQLRRRQRIIQVTALPCFSRSQFQNHYPFSFLPIETGTLWIFSKGSYSGQCVWRWNKRSNEVSMMSDHYPTCSPDLTYCPDNQCDELERLDPRICPQDCTVECKHSLFFSFFSFFSTVSTCFS